MRLPPQRMPLLLTPWILSAFGGVFWATHATPTSQAPLIFHLGEQRLLAVPGLKRYSLGQPLFKVLPLPRELASGLGPSEELLLLKAVKIGATDLWVWKKEGPPEHRSLRVEALVGKKNSPSFEKSLGLLEEVEVFWTPKGALLRGPVRSLSELEKIRALTLLYPKEIWDETHLNPKLLEQGATLLRAWISEKGLPLHLETTPEGLLISGSVSSPAQKKNIEQSVRRLFPKTECDLHTLPGASPTLYFQIFLIELHKTAFQEWGLQWPSLSEGLLHRGSFQSLWQLASSLKHLETKGQGKILSHPQLVVRTPGEASLFAGGELPIATHTRSQAQVQWKKYGLSLQLKVEEQARSSVRLDLTTEVSHLTQWVGNLPSFGSNRLHTQIDVALGSPLFLSGLFQKQLTQGKSGLPWLQDVPLLGELFRSNQFQHQESELIALLYPLAQPPQSFRWQPAPSTSLLPKGFIPIPRKRFSFDEEERLKRDPQYPWNAFEGSLPAP